MDATAVAVDILKQQDEKLQRENSGLWPYWLALSGSIGGIGAILAAVAAFIAASRGFKQWLGNRQDEQVKRAEERFQKVVEGLGSERVEAQAGAAIVLRTFLQKEQGYERFYSQTFDLAVAHLRLRGINPTIPESSHPPKSVSIIVPNMPLTQEKQPSLAVPFSLNSLSQALITVFRESFPLARDRLKEQESEFRSQLLDATDVQLDNAYLAGADLAEAWLVRASLREAVLSNAQLKGATLSGARLEGAKLLGARLEGATLVGAQLEGATLFRAQLEGATLFMAQLKGANLSGAQLKGATLSNAQLEGADLSEAQLEGADLFRAQLEGANLFRAQLKGANLSGAQLKGAKLLGAQLDDVTNLENASSLKDTDLREVKGLTKERAAICKAKGAIIDEELMTSSSQSSVSPSAPAQSSDAQAPSAPSTQVNTLTSGINDGSTTSSQPSPES